MLFAALLATLLSLFVRTRAKSAAAAAAGGGAGKSTESYGTKPFLGGNSWSVLTVTRSYAEPNPEFKIFQKNALVFKVDGRLVYYYAALVDFTSDLTDICEVKLNKDKVRILEDPNNITDCFVQTFSAYFVCDHYCCGLDCCELNYGILLFILSAVALVGAVCVLFLHCFFTTSSPAEELKKSLDVTRSPIYVRVKTGKDTEEMREKKVVENDEARDVLIIST